MDAKLIEAVKERNALHIKNALTMITRRDRGFHTGEFDEALEYVKKQNISDLYTPFDGEEFKPESEWNEEYWTEINVTLMDNFCPERIELLKKIGRKVYPQPPAQSAQSDRSNNQSARPSARSNTQSAQSNRSSGNSARGGGSSGAGMPPFVPAAIAAVILIVIAVIVLSKCVLSK